MNTSANLKQDVRLFLHGYVGYTDASKLTRTYLSIVEKSMSIHQLDENIEKTTMNHTTMDERSAEAIQSLHKRIRHLLV